MANSTEYRRALISEAEVRELLDPHLPTLTRCVRQAWDLWVTGGAPNFPEPLRRNQATFVSNGFHNLAKATYADKEGVGTVEESERLLLVIGKRFVLRFKLLDEQWHTRNHSTAASDAMDGQRQIAIEGLETLPRVVLGYRVGGTPVALRDIYVVFAIDREPLWKYNAEESLPSQHALPFPEKDAEPAAAGSRFKIAGEATKPAKKQKGRTRKS